MSNHNLPVHLPNDRLCEGCPRLVEYTDMCEELGVRLKYVGLPGGEVGHYRDDNCPLIAVTEVRR